MSLLLANLSQNSIIFKNMSYLFIRIYITESQVRDFCLNSPIVFHLSNRSSFRSLNFSSFRSLQSGINKRKKICDHLDRKNAAVYEKDLAKVSSFIDKYIPYNAIEKIVYKCAVKTNKTREKKLRNLTKNVT